MTPRLSWRWLGRMPYRAGRELQESRRERLLGGDSDAACLLLLEHDPVVTLGRHARADHVLASAAELAERGVDLVRTNRGGDVTYHGPGQLMVYPVVPLGSGVVGYLAALAAGLAEVAAALGVPGAEWRRAPAGLWLGAAKLGACGIHVRHRVASHGWALNIDTPADAWRLIVPCGMADACITSIAAQRAGRGLGPPPPMSTIAALAAGHLARALGYEATPTALGVLVAATLR